MRKAVQNVMMRPSTALHYIADVEKIVLELIEKIEDEMDNNSCTEVKKLLQQYTTDAISFMFTGHEVGALRETEDGQKMLANLDLILKIWSEMIFLPVPLAKYHPKMNKLGR